MGNIRRFLLGIVLVSIAFIMLSSTVTVAEDTRFSGSVTVPQWNVGDKWGYKVPEYSYSSTYIGVGFEVVGTETINGHECYKVKIWWDSGYGSEEDGLDMDFDIPGFTYEYGYSGFAYFTTEDLAIAKFVMSFKMYIDFDGSKMMDMSNYGTRPSVDMPDIDDMKDWWFEVDMGFDVTYTFDPPFIMYDYPLELDKTWESSSEVTVDWSYKMKYDISDAYKDYIDQYAGEYSEYDMWAYANEEGSDTTSYTLNGNFEVVDESTVITDDGSYSVFEIDYDISISYTRGEYYDIPSTYGGMSAPGGDATLALCGGSDGSGTSYYDPVEGYPQKIDEGVYSTTTYSTVDPTNIENSYDNYSDSYGKSDRDGDDKKDDGNNMLLILALIIVVVVVVVVILVVFISKRKRHQYPPPGYYQGQGQQYPQAPPAQPQQQYPQQPQGQPPRDDYYQRQEPYPPQRPRNDYPPQEPRDNYPRY